MASKAQRPSQQSCVSCRRLKRKCSKALPQCSLCSRVGRVCQYPDSPTIRKGMNGSKSSLSPRSLAATVGSSPASPLRSPRSTALVPFFLDTAWTRDRTFALPDDLRWNDVAGGERMVAMSSEKAASVAERFFSTVHTWLPIVSKVRFARLVRSEKSLERADVQALFFAMALSDDHPDSSVDDRGYGTIKFTLTRLEQHGQFSTSFLAAYVLLAVYEMSQAIYPAAYFTVAHVSRVFFALGLNDRHKAFQLLPATDTWTESEERRRIWWAVLILDRHLHAGLRSRPLSTPSIPPNEILPADDSDWDRGELAVNPLLVMSNEALVLVSPYGRTCQASHLLGRACNHVNEHTSAPDVDFHFEEALQISRNTHALLALIDADSQRLAMERCFLFTARSLCYATLLAVYDAHSCIEETELETTGSNRGLRLQLQQDAINGFKTTIGLVSEFVLELRDYLSKESVSKLSPLLCHCLYSTAGTYAWYIRENSNEGHREKLNDLQLILEMLGRSWPIAEEYLRLLEGQDQCS